MLTDADRALEKLAGNDLWRPYGLLLAGTARALLGDDDAATILGRAVAAAERLEAHDSKLLALVESSLARGEPGVLGRLPMRTCSVPAASPRSTGSKDIPGLPWLSRSARGFISATAAGTMRRRRSPERSASCRV